MQPDPDPIASCICRLIDAGKKDAKTFNEQGDDIARYTTSSDYGFLYQDFPEELSFKARINKASEFAQIMGPYLYPNNPDATVNPEPWAGYWSRKRADIEERYADYSARHGELAVHMNRVITSALIMGRGALVTGFNARKGIAQSVFETSRNVIIDPDARVPEEINWMARRRIKPRWELNQRYKESAAIIATLPRWSPPQRENSKKARWNNPDSDLVEYYEVWMRVAPTVYDPNMPATASNEPRKYCVANNHLLHEGPWEIPFFRIDEWPISLFDPLENPGELYPTIPLEPAVGHLRALNWIYTLYLSKMRFTTRTPLIRVVKPGVKLDVDNFAKLARGEQIDILTVTVDAGNEDVDINKIVQQFNWNTGVEELERLYNLAGREFEKASGLAEVLYSGQTPTQIRTATAAELIEQKSRTRIDNMREAVVRFMQRDYRKRVFAARYLHGAEDIGRLFGAEAGALWGEIGTPDVIAQEQQMRAQVMAQMQAQEQAMGLPPSPPDVLEESLGPPTFVDLDQWATEADRTIDAGSMRRLDIDGQLQNINVALNQLGPAMVNLPGGGEFVAQLAAEFTKINRLSPELQEAARNMRLRLEQAAAMGAATTQAAPNPAAGPAAGPTGGEPMLAGAEA